MRTSTLSTLFLLVAMSVALAQPDNSPPPRIHLSPDEAGKSLLKFQNPKYPEAARSRHIHGRVVLDVIIGIDGRVKEMKVESGDPLLAQATKDAVQTWLYLPFKKKDHVVEVETRVRYDFKMHRP